MKRTIADATTVELSDGVFVSQLSAGERLQGQHVHMEPSSRVDTHDHPNEQLTYVLDGTLDLIVDGERVTLAAGESLLIPGGAAHAAETRPDTSATAFDVFSPPRDDLPDLE